MAFFMNGKYRRPIINPIFRCNLLRSQGNSQGIPSIADKGDPSVLISFQMFSYRTFIWSILM